jgi:hypothetical protein
MIVPVPPELKDRPFTVGEAASHGLTRKMLRGSRFVNVFPRVFAPADLELDHVQLIRAAQLSVGRHAAASHESGLALWDVHIGTRGSVHLTTRRQSPTRIVGITMHRSPHLGPISLIDGCRALSAERCLVDASTRRSLCDLVVAGDWLIRNRCMTVDSFHHFVHDSHYDGVVKARRVADFLRPGSESPRESVVRMLIILAGLPEPECNVSFGDEFGFVARLDMSYERWKVAVEYDGRQHGLDLIQRERDVRRREAMERLGWVFIIVTAAHLKRPREIVERVDAALRSRGYRGPAPFYGLEWTRNFT